MADATTPYTFLSEDAELRVEPDYYAEHWAGPRAQAPSASSRRSGCRSDRLLHRARSRRLLGDRPARLPSSGSSRRAAGTTSTRWPSRPTSRPGTACGCRRTGPSPSSMREPVIKTFHNPTQYLDYVLRGVGADDVARGYVGDRPELQLLARRRPARRWTPTIRRPGPLRHRPELARAIGYRAYDRSSCGRALDAPAGRGGRWAAASGPADSSTSASRRPCGAPGGVGLDPEGAVADEGRTTSHDRPTPPRARRAGSRTSDSIAATASSTDTNSRKSRARRGRTGPTPRPSTPRVRRRRPASRCSGTPAAAPRSSP